MSNARIYSNCPGPKVHSASNNFKSPAISDPVPVRAGDGVDIDRCIMHLSMSTPSPPRTGLGGRYRGFEIVLIQTAQPWGRFDNQSARTIRVGEWRRGYTKAYVYHYKSYYIYKFTPYPQDCLITNLRSEGLQHSTALRSRPRCMYTCTNVAAISNIAALNYIHYSYGSGDPNK